MDWKDKLSAFRGSLDSPEPETNVEAFPQDNNIVQKEPLTVLTDKKGRNGKIATIIEGFLCEDTKVEEIARKLKQKLGVGGSMRNGEILIQGDRKKEVTELLQSMGFKVKG